MNRAKSELERALADVPASEEKIGRWEADLQAKREALADLEGRAGAEALADQDAADRLAHELAVLRAGVDVVTSATAAAHSGLLEARRAVMRARASELRIEAQELRDEAAKRKVRTDKLIAELEAWEDGASYLACEPWMIEMRPLPAGRPFRMPKTQQLLNRAAQRDKQAEMYDERATTGHPSNLVSWVAHLAAEAAEATQMAVAA